MIVSNSDIETAQKCEYMFYWSRILRLRPRVLSIWLKRGSFGHDCMEVGFQVILDGGTVEDAAIAIGTGPLQKLMESEDPDAAEMMKVYRHVTAFITFTQSDEVHWKPVALEDRGMWNLNTGTDVTKEEAQDSTDLVFGYTPDIVIEFTHGAYKGQRAVLDYKFLSQYMSDVKVNMSQQIHKYLIYRNKAHPEHKMRRGAFVVLNTRADASATGHKLFTVRWIEPNKHRMQRIEVENERLIAHVADLYNKPKDELNHTVNKDVCDWCFFGKDLCPADFDGKPIDKIIEREYVHNEYGYNDVQP